MGRGGYATAAFWTEWFNEEEHLAPYDWLVSWEDVGDCVEALLEWKHDARVLMVGAGNSPFSSEMYARGYRKIVNVDNCETVVESQRLRYPMLEWLVADVRQMPFDNDSFDVVIDKGCLDNLFCYVEPQNAVEAYVAEVRRLLTPRRGKFLVVSCHDALAVTEALANAHWRFAIVDLPNPRWPIINIQTYQLAFCEKTTPNSGENNNSDHDESLSRALTDAKARLSSGENTTPPADSRLPRRLRHLEDRASGRRHSSLILESSPS